MLVRLGIWIGQISLIRFGGLKAHRSFHLPLLPPDEEPVSPAYDAIYQPGAVACQPVNVRTLSRFFEFALALSAWKKAGESEWALRSNPSSGNLHPTEGYLLVPQIDGLDLKARVSIITRRKNMGWS